MPYLQVKKGSELTIRYEPPKTKIAAGAVPGPVTITREPTWVTADVHAVFIGMYSEQVANVNLPEPGEEEVEEEEPDNLPTTTPTSLFPG